VKRAWLCLAAALLEGAALAAEAPTPNPLDILPIPENDPGPAWLKAGLRLTYSGNARYGTAFEGQMSGGGFTQITVVGMDARTVALELRSYNVAEPGNPAGLVAQAGAIGTPGRGSEWWVNPAALQNVREVNPDLDGDNLLKTKETVIVRLGYPLKGKVYKAIRFRHWQYAKGVDIWLHRVYDEGTGILLYRRETTRSFGDEQVTIAQFENCRALALPWAAGPAPTWLRTTTLLGYDGQFSVAIPGMQPAIRFLSLEMTMNRRGDTWAEYSVKTNQANAPADTTPTPQPSKAKGVSGSAQIGGLWLPPHLLGTLQAGQMIDQDPFTKFETKVVSIGRRPDGLDVVVLSEGHAAQRITYTYDRGSGILLEYTQVVAEPQEMTTTVRLTKRQ
jgi:hypothetical protein